MLALMLYAPEAHEAFGDLPWSEAEARAAIVQIVDETESRWRSETWWPVHPDDEIEQVSATVYDGAAGVIAALRVLRRSGYGADLDLADAARQVRLATPTEYDNAWERGSYMLGPVGIDLIALLLGDDEAGARLRATCLANLNSVADELFSGIPGTLLAAVAAASERPHEGWDAIVASSVEALWSRWDAEDGWLWRQTALYDRFGGRYVGAAHGTVGNAAALLAAGDALGDARRGILAERLAATLDLLALRDGDEVNWPRRADLAGPFVLQWCHGAPGIVTSLARLHTADGALEALLLAAGETIWQAGPLVKGSSICHGTAGNGYAFLALHCRTGDERWLGRARRFAMHALSQMRAERERFGCPHLTMWTGDLGVALYLDACLRADSRLCTIEGW